MMDLFGKKRREVEYRQRIQDSKDKADAAWVRFDKANREMKVKQDKALVKRVSEYPAFGSVLDCPKCGIPVDPPEELEFLENLEFGMLKHGSMTLSIDNPPSVEWIERSCPLCGFEWSEQCADAGEKGSE